MVAKQGAVDWAELIVKTVEEHTGDVPLRVHLTPVVEQIEQSIEELRLAISQAQDDADVGQDREAALVDEICVLKRAAGSLLAQLRQGSKLGCAIDEMDGVLMSTSEWGP